MEQKKNTKEREVQGERHIPRTWALCYQEGCAMRKKCLRYIIRKNMAENMEEHLCVLPSSRADGKTCSHFVEDKKYWMAWGMRQTFSNVSIPHHKLMKKELEKYFRSHSTYYRYFNGERPLTPEQQQWVEALLHKYGYEGPAHFDRVEETFNFRR